MWLPPSSGGDLFNRGAVGSPEHGDQFRLLRALARCARLGRGFRFGGGVRRGLFGRRVRRARRRCVLGLDADGGEACVGRNQRDAVTVAGLAPDGLALAQVGVDLFEEALGEHRADHLGGGATAQALRQRQGDMLGPPGDPTQRIVFMKAAQVGATEAGNNWIGFAIHQAPGPMLAVQPTVELAKRNSRQRIDPLIDESPELRERVKPARSRDAGNTMLSKEFAGGILIMTGANSAVGLRSTPARYIFLDEVDAYPASADEEGDPVTLAEARSGITSRRSIRRSAG